MSECIPSSKCEQRCPVVKILNDNIDSHDKQIDGIISMSVSETPERIAEALSAGLESMGISEDDDNISTEELASGIREMNSQKFELLKAHNAEMNANRAALMAACSGPLALRTVDGGTQYTARICRSKRIVESDEPEPVFVSRKKL